MQELPKLEPSVRFQSRYRRVSRTPGPAYHPSTSPSSSSLSLALLPSFTGKNNILFGFLAEPGEDGPVGSSTFVSVTFHRAFYFFKMNALRTLLAMKCEKAFEYTHLMMEYN